MSETIHERSFGIFEVGEIPQYHQNKSTARKIDPKTPPP
jgi:hypothetical protein